MTAPPLGVYVHWPFCTRICPYCDFNVYKNRRIDADAWSSALTAELRYWADITARTPLESLYFGGGTPSLAPLTLLEAVIDACASLWGFVPNAEITLEANPSHVNSDQLTAFRAIGVNRLSLGVQSLRDDALAFLGRDHNADQARAALAATVQRFPNSSFDLIYARPGQSIAAWRAELSEALAFGARHLSAYQLTIENGTAFAKAVARGDWTPTTDDRAADFFDATDDLTESAGLPAYEISNHATPDAQAVHNTLYWTGGDYVGVGPGAHGRITIDGARRATETERRPDAYLARIAEKGVGAFLDTALSEEERLNEAVSMGLRLREGLALQRLPALSRMKIQDRASELEALGLMVTGDDRLRATASGRRVLNAVIAELLR